MYNTISIQKVKIAILLKRFFNKIVTGLSVIKLMANSLLYIISKRDAFIKVQLINLRISTYQHSHKDSYLIYKEDSSCSFNIIG